MLISNDVVYHDVDATAFGYKLGQIPQMPLENLSRIKIT